tara:strand:- start:881 stop:1255 length:375 start_codon:yes stop_codon:yes gene_type:complete
MNLDQLNIFNEPLEECSNEPKTGFFRTGCCETDAQDIGTHTVCAIMDKEFLQFSLHQGNDLITPVADFDFPGLKPGDRWCLCANRWLEAFEAGFAPHIIARATNIKTLDIIPLDKIKLFAIDIV